MPNRSVRVRARAPTRMVGTVVSRRPAGDLGAIAAFTVAVVIACTALWRRRE
jgi:hypothetical protein